MMHTITCANCQGVFTWPRRRRFCGDQKCKNERARVAQKEARLDPEYKAHRLAYMREHYAQNKERYVAYHRAWRAKRDKLRQASEPGQTDKPSE